MDLDHVSALQIVAWTSLVGVLAWASAHLGIAKKVEAVVATEKAKFQAVEKRVEDYTDAEVVKLATAFVERLAATADQAKIKADADAVLASRAALLSKVQATVAAAKPGA